MFIYVNLIPRVCIHIYIYIYIYTHIGKTTSMEYNKVCICTALCNISSTLEMADKLIEHNIIQEVFYQTKLRMSVVYPSV